MRIIEDILCIISLLIFSDFLLDKLGLYELMYQIIREREEINKVDEWIITTYKNVYGLTVYERVCPYCRYKETYHGDNTAVSCYVCGKKLAREEAA